MPASTPDLLSGTFFVAIRFPSDIRQAEPTLTRRMLEAFLLGIDHGFFDATPSCPATRQPDSTLWREDDAGIRMQFAAANLPPAAFSILSGMFVGYAAHLGAACASVTAVLEGSSEGDLLSSSARLLPALPRELPFQVEAPHAGNEHKTLRVWLDFDVPIPDPEKDHLIEFFAVWDALVLGPFPAPGRAIGDSWAGPSKTSFLLTTRLEHFVEDYESGSEAFATLLRGLLRVHAHLPIESLEIE